jgi:HPt (histidine-containing phosphotransfer) domain-containing protein
MSDDNVLSPTILAFKREEMKESGGINWLINLFLDELPNYVNQLQQAIASRDAETLFLVAHKFKGSCYNIGAVGMITLCKQLEELGRAVDMEKAAAIVESDVEKEVGRLRNALELEKQQDEIL